MVTRRRLSRGFTLVELLVVITIIGMLMAMVLPATGQIMEAARRMACGRSQVQIGQAIKTYASTNQCLPPGLPSCTRPEWQHNTGGVDSKAICQGPNWATSILSSLGEPTLAKGVEDCLASNDASDPCTNVCESAARSRWGSVGTTTPASFICGSAERMSVANRLSDWGLDKLSKGNFAANFGAGTYDDAITLSSDSNNPTKLQEKRKLRGPFSVVSNFGIQPQMVLKATSARDAALRSGWKASRDRGTKLASLRDGDSRTIMVSEVIGYDSSSDGRGVWTNTSMGASIFSAKIPPNADASSREEYMDHTQLCDVHIEKDDPYHMACKRVRESHGRNLYAAARSGHPEGLNVLMCDSSVRYVANTVDPEVWKGVATIAGSENVDLP